MSRNVGSKIVYQLRLPIFISHLRGKTRSSENYGIPGKPVMEEKNKQDKKTYGKWVFQ